MKNNFEIKKNDITIDTANSQEEAEQKVKQLIDAELQEYLDSLDIYCIESFVDYYKVIQDERKYMVAFRHNDETITDEMHDTEEAAEKELEEMALEDFQNYKEDLRIYKEDFFRSSEYTELFEKKYRENYEIEEIEIEE